MCKDTKNSYMYFKYIIGSPKFKSDNIFFSFIFVENGVFAKVRYFDFYKIHIITIS